MKRETHYITLVLPTEHLTVIFEQRGKKLVVKTEREGVASSLLQELVNYMVKEKKGTREGEACFPSTQAIGFHPNESPPEEQP